jgi:TPP-dependent pyruvate/acetoin dehydrogenase alpha subunit
MHRFYMTSTGEEATQIASAAALHAEDEVFGQYREPGVLMWRGFSLQVYIFFSSLHSKCVRVHNCNTPIIRKYAYR